MADDKYRLSARLEVDYLNETYKWELPESDEYETLGGLIVNETGEIPEQGTEITLGIFRFSILEVSNTKIDLVKLEVMEDQ